MSNGAAWGRTFALVAAPVLALLGLLLALLALPGVTATARIVLTETTEQQALTRRLGPAVVAGYHAQPGRPSAVADQRRSLVFFRAVPLLFTLVWIALLVLALVLPA